MKINGEEVELVTDFAQLRTGMVVIVKNCRMCGHDERCMLGNPGIGISNGEEHPAFEALPSCLPKKTFVTSLAVGNRRVFRVVDPLLDAKPVTRAKELAR